jgi:hypothetical protein
MLTEASFDIGGLVEDLRRDEAIPRSSLSSGSWPKESA